MEKFDEKTTIEDYLVERLKERGWRFVPADELERESPEEPMLLSLSRILEKINRDSAIGEEEIKKAVNELKLTSSSVEGSKSILNYLKFGVAVKLEKERTVERVRIFDYSDYRNNEFVFSRQVSFRSADRNIRPDLILYINGIPLVIIECKNPADISVSWLDAYRQIENYKKDVPELFKYLQLGLAVESVAKYFPVVPWTEEAIEIQEWRADEGKDSVDSAIEMLSPAVLPDIIRNFLFFKIRFGVTTKVLPRYVQFRTVNKIMQRTMDNLAGREEKNRGLIWHWQGSGKTLTMIFAAQKLLYLPELQNPTIFLIVDREDLETQLYEEFGFLDLTKPERIASIDELKNVILHDDAKGKRGIFIVLIHKFRPEELAELGKEIERVSGGRETIMTRKNIIAFIDEGHRTQYGTLAAQMKSILKNAFFFAFTGTPISVKARDTYREFSYPPEESYLDRYFIQDSIEDGFTVKIVCQPRLEKDVRLKKEILENFFSQTLEEIPEEVREGVEKKVREKLNQIKVILENPNRIDKICKDISSHFRENIDGKFKGMIVAGSRKACVTYKEILDRYLPEEYSEVVITYNRTDPEEIRRYFNRLTARFKTTDDADIKKDIIERFKGLEHPKILIVTEMLLTGFDAPGLQVMYMDKPLKGHRLLQAIARTNRPFKDLKECGLVIDYVGILKELDKAFKIYSKEDLAGAVYDMDALKQEFEELVKECTGYLPGVPKDRFDRNTLLEAFEILTTDRQTGKSFVQKIRFLQRRFELLGPDEIKIRLFREYKWLMAVHAYYRKMLDRDNALIEKEAENYFSRTVKYVYETVELKDLKEDMPQITFGEDYLSRLQKIKNPREKAATIVFALHKLVLVDKYRNPVYESLADRVEKILNLWKEKNKDYERIYQEGLKIKKDMDALSNRQKKLGLSDLEYSILLVLEKRFPRIDMVQDLKKLMKIITVQVFPGWTAQRTTMKEVEKQVRRFLRKYIKPYNLDIPEIDNLSQQIKGNFEKYGQG